MCATCYDMGPGPACDFISLCSHPSFREGLVNKWQQKHPSLVHVVLRESSREEV
eukprot:jgi/Botrbrau1/5924/Bobra.0366s0098.1